MAPDITPYGTAIESAAKTMGFGAFLERATQYLSEQSGLPQEAIGDSFRWVVDSYAASKVGELGKQYPHLTRAIKGGLERLNGAETEATPTTSTTGTTTPEAPSTGMAGAEALNQYGQAIANHVGGNREAWNDPANHEALTKGLLTHLYDNHFTEDLQQHFGSAEGFISTATGIAGGLSGVADGSNLTANAPKLASYQTITNIVAGGLSAAGQVMFKDDPQSGKVFQEGVGLAQTTINTAFSSVTDLTHNPIGNFAGEMVGVGIQKGATALGLPPDVAKDASELGSNSIKLVGDGMQAAGDVGALVATGGLDIPAWIDLAQKGVGIVKDVGGIVDSATGLVKKGLDAVGQKISDAIPPEVKEFGRKVGQVCDATAKVLDTTLGLVPVVGPLATGAFNAITHPLDAVGKAVGGVVDAVTHPLDTAGKALHAVTHPVETIGKISEGLGINKALHAATHPVETIGNAINAIGGLGKTLFGGGESEMAKEGSEEHHTKGEGHNTKARTTDPQANDQKRQKQQAIQAGVQHAAKVEAKDEAKDNAAKEGSKPKAGGYDSPEVRDGTPQDPRLAAALVAYKEVSGDKTPKVKVEGDATGIDGVTGMPIAEGHADVRNANFQQSAEDLRQKQQKSALAATGGDGKPG